MSRHRSLARALPACVVAVLALVALTACGSSGSSDAASTTTTSSSGNAGGSGASGSSAFAKYTNCLKQHGVTVPSFTGRRPTGTGAPPTGTNQGSPPSGTNQGGGFGSGGAQNMTAAQRAAFQKAQSACASLRPRGAFGGPGQSGGQGQSSQAFAAFNNCLKLHGVTLSGTARPNFASAKVRKAMSACAALRPTPSAGGQPPASTNANQG